MSQDMLKTKMPIVLKTSGIKMILHCKTTEKSIKKNSS